MQVKRKRQQSSIFGASSSSTTAYSFGKSSLLIRICFCIPATIFVALFFCQISWINSDHGVRERTVTAENKNVQQQGQRLQQQKNQIRIQRDDFVITPQGIRKRIRDPEEEAEEVDADVGLQDEEDLGEGRDDGEENEDHEGVDEENGRNNAVEDDVDEGNDEYKSMILDKYGDEMGKATFSYLRQFKSLHRSMRFYHIPKTAGTAIEYAAGKTTKQAWGSCLFRHKPKRDICHYPDAYQGEWPQHIGWWHIPRSFFPLSNIDPYQHSELFAVVRESYDRMVSEYNYICTLKVLDWRPDQCDRKRFLDKDYMNEWLQSKLGSFEDGDSSALTYLTDNGHFTPQYEFMVGPNDVRMIDHVLHLEDDLDQQFARLMESLDDPSSKQIRLKKLNALGAESRGGSMLGVDLDERTVEFIRKKYPHDFETFGYDDRVRKTNPTPIG